MESRSDTTNSVIMKAQKRVKDIKGFYTHLTVYCIVIPSNYFCEPKI